MPDQPEQQTADEPQVDAGGAVLSFHVGDGRQFVTAVGQALRLRVPTARPAFGTDDDGNPRPDPTLAPAAAESRSERTGPAPVPDSRPAADPKADPKR